MKKIKQMAATKNKRKHQKREEIEGGEVEEMEEVEVDLPQPSGERNINDEITNQVNIVL